MGVSVSPIASSSSRAIMTKRLFGLMENDEGDGNVSVNEKSIDFESRNLEATRRLVSFNGQESKKISVARFKKSNLGKLNVQTIISFKNSVLDNTYESMTPKASCLSEPDAAATTLQKFYKSYRTRRSLADCAVVVEELWWKALGSETLFDYEKTETAVSRWARGGTMAAKVGKGLSKDDKAQKLALRHWLEAIDPRHRYGHNLHFYYNVWFESSSCQPFFYWLDIGDGKEISLDKCPRTDLQHQCIRYLGLKEREEYEVIVEKGKLAYKQSGMLVNTGEGSKWIFVLGTSRNLYVGEKKKGHFQHSSFLSGGAIIAAGRLVARDGLLEAIWAYSGHYQPTEEHFTEFINFLEEHQVELGNVKKCPIDDDIPPKPKVNSNGYDCTQRPKSGSTLDIENRSKAQTEARKWTTGAGPRIGCVRDYPTQLQFQALEQVNLSPRTSASGLKNGPIPSPRPSPNIHLSPRIASTIGIGLASPTLHV